MAETQQAHMPPVKDEAEEAEFFIPKPKFGLADYIARGDMRGIHHLARYEWASTALKGSGVRSILDIACGAGYGSAMLARAYPNASVLGVDYDGRAVAFASQHEREKNLAFSRGNMVAWERIAPNGACVPLGRFDAVVSFDTIEHLLHREIALMRIAENLTDDGVLILSTPCCHDQSVLFPGWEHHKIEYSHSDLMNLLRRFFHQVDDAGGPDFPNAAFWANLNTPTEVYPNAGNPLVCRGPIRVDRGRPSWLRRVFGR